MTEVDARWDTLFDGLFADIDVIVLRVREAMQLELPSYRTLDPDGLDVEVRIEVDRVLRCARSGGAVVSEHELAELAEVGVLRAQQGVPIDEMLRAWRIGVQVVIGCARELEGRGGVDTPTVLDFAQSTLGWSDAAMLTTARAHRGAELELVRKDEERRSLFVREALLGTLAPVDARTNAGTFGLDPGRDYHAVRARLPETTSRRAAEQALGLEGSSLGGRGLSTLIAGDLAGFVREPPKTDLDFVVGLGPARPLEQLGESFRLATRALDTADIFGMTGSYDVGALGLRVAIAADRDVGTALWNRYVAPLAASDPHEELVAGLREYFLAGMSVSQTATRMFVHQNTVRYRLAKFEELAGVSLRDPGVAFDVWWALEWATVRSKVM